MFNRTTKPVTPTFKSELEQRKTLTYKKPLTLEQEAQIYKATGKLPTYTVERESEKFAPLPEQKKETPPEKERTAPPPKKKRNTSFNANHAWTIKGIELETRIALTKASKQLGMRLGAYCNQMLREAAQRTLTYESTPINQDALREEIKTELRDEFKAEIALLKKTLPMLIQKAVNNQKSKEKQEKGLLKGIFNR